MLEGKWTDALVFSPPWNFGDSSPFDLLSRVLSNVFEHGICHFYSVFGKTRADDRHHLVTLVSYLDRAFQFRLWWLNFLTANNLWCWSGRLGDGCFWLIVRVLQCLLIGWVWIAVSPCEKTATVSFSTLGGSLLKLCLLRFVLCLKRLRNHLGRFFRLFKCLLSGWLVWGETKS